MKEPSEVRHIVAKRAYCKNTVNGKQRGKKYPAKFRAEVLMAMLASNSICAVARQYGVPESTIRSWMAEEAARSDAFARERQAAAREIAVRAALGVRTQVTYLQGRAEESQRAAEVTGKLHRRLDEAARARDFAVGTLLKSDAEELADAAETALVLRSTPGTYDRQLTPDEEKRLASELTRYSGRQMADKDAANVAKVLMEVAEKAAAMTPAQADHEESGPPMVEISREECGEGEGEVIVLEKTEG